MKPIALQEPKKCSCGIVHTEIPESRKISVEDGAIAYWWNCSCKSTLFKLFGKIVRPV